MRPSLLAVAALVVGLAVALAGCGGSSATKSPAATQRATPTATAADDKDAFATQACAGSTYEGCYDGVIFWMVNDPGATIAICEYGDGTGDAITIEEGEDPEDDCSADGLITPSKVFKVIDLP